MLPVLIVLRSRAGRPAGHSARSNDLARRVRVISYNAIVAWFVTLLSCTEMGPPSNENPPLEEEDDSFVSDPSGASPVVLGSSVQHLAGPAIVYIALAPGTFTAPGQAYVSHRASGFRVTAAIVDGGMDPISIPADVGDTVDIGVNNGGGTGPGIFTVEKVPISRRPRVVRTIPQRRKTDVPLNVRVTVVFSEPMEGASITSQTIQLMRGTTVVPGIAQFVNTTLDATRVTVEFIPNAPLAANTDFELVVTTGVRDLDGATLSQSERYPFTTGEGVTGPPARLILTPDSLLTLALGTSYQATASVRDAAGNAINDQTVTWSSNNPSTVRVTATGLITALGAGGAAIIASVPGVSRLLTVDVPPNPPTSVRKPQ